MSLEYSVPHVQLIGNAGDVILGGSGFGADFSGEWMALTAEFEDDESQMEKALLGGIPIGQTGSAA